VGKGAIGASAIGHRPLGSRRAQPNTKAKCVSSDEEILRFIAARFPSVWALELLLLLRRQGGKCARADLVERLRASELVIANALDALMIARLVSIEDDYAEYTPANDAVEASVDRAEYLYHRRPNAVCRAIISARTGSVSAFADAFKLRGKRSD